MKKNDDFKKTHFLKMKIIKILCRRTDLDCTKKIYFLGQNSEEVIYMSP